MGALFHTKSAAQRAVERQADRAARLVQVEDAIFSKLVQSEAYTGNEVTAPAEAKPQRIVETKIPNSSNSPLRKRSAGTVGHRGDSP